MVKVLALGTFFSYGASRGRRVPKTITRFGYKMFSIRKNNITVYSHTKQKRKEIDISPAYKLSYEHSSAAMATTSNIYHLLHNVVVKS